MQYWHQQMHKPKGRGQDEIDPMNMLRHTPPIIGTGEWDHYQCTNFKKAMKIGDIVCIRKGKKAIALCEIISDYFTDISLENLFLHHNYRKVKILSLNPPTKDFPKTQGTLNISKNVDTESWEFIDEWYNTYKSEQSMEKYIELLKSNKNLIFTGAPGTGKTYLAKEIAKAMKAETEFVQFHPSYDYTDFVEGLRPLKKGNGELGFELKDGQFKSFCKKALKNIEDSLKTEEELKDEDIAFQKIADFLDESINDGKEFTLATGNKFTILEYNDTHIKVNAPNNEITSEITLQFSELLKLLLNEQNITKVKDVKTFFKRSHNRQSDSYIYKLYNDDGLKRNFKSTNEIKKVEQKDFVFIIDEINRAEISKVFGELFFSIDPGYRGKEVTVKTQYSNLQDENDVFYNGFYVPKNVYIIATMNDIDRSVESMDFAMRRRFAWQEIKANDRISMWNGNIEDFKNEAEIRMKTLNEKIEKIQGLSSAYHIGPAYFLKLKEYKNKENPFECLWENHLKIVMFDYLRGLPDSKKLLEDLKNAYNMVNDD